MTQITVQDGKIVLRDGKVGTGEGCCCRETVCDETCGWPRFLSVTLSGFPAGYYWSSRNGGQPPAGGGFSPSCGEDAGDPQIRVGGSAFGVASYLSRRYADYNTTFTAEYQEYSGCTCPIWYGQFDVSGAGGLDNLPAEECNVDPVGMTITLCQQNSFTTIAIDPPSGSGGSTATATVTAITSGAITAVSITSGGSGYAYLEVLRSEPTLNIEVDTASGDDAAFGITLSETTDFNGDAVWGISSVSVTNPGSGYALSDTAYVTVTDGTESYAAWIQLHITRVQPTVEVAINTATGVDALLQVVLDSFLDFNGDEVWYVDSITVLDGGSGYDAADTLTLSAGGDGSVEFWGASATLSVVGGVIDGVVVTDPGEYAKTDGTIDSVTVFDPGEYYKETVTDTVIVDEPVVTISTNTGKAALISATVDDDPDSPTFGKIASLSIDAGGEKYSNEGKSWYLSFQGFGLWPLEGRRPGAILPEGTYYLSPVNGFICQGTDQAGEAGVFSDRVALTKCGESLLSRTYPAYYSVSIAQNFGAVANMDGGSKYSVGDGEFAGQGCQLFSVVDWGSGPMTVTISPA